jgi:3-oxoacyl-[acyl-carrier-protein] synthase II
VTVTITAAGLAVPGVTDAGDLLRDRPEQPSPVDPAARIGGKGLRYKDRATQLAITAATTALLDAGLLESPRATVTDGDSVAVVVSSNLGNVDTVCRVVRTIADAGTGALSPMDIPNASSNNIAAELAIRFGLRGPNLTLCSGGTAGTDAIRWARNLLRAQRATAVLVVGVEPDNLPARLLIERDRVVDGAAALVLEPSAARGAPGLAVIAGRALADDAAGCLDLLRDGGTPAAWFAPDGLSEAETRTLLPGVPRYDLDRTWGAGSGALGVLQCAAALGWYTGGGTGTVLALTRDHAAAPVAGLALRPPARTS